MQKLFLTMVSLLLLPIAAALSQQATSVTSSTHLMGADELRTALVGHTITGTNNVGQTYTQTFNVGGSITARTTQGSGPSIRASDGGVWHLNGDWMCVQFDHWRYHKDRCFQVRVDQRGFTNYASSGHVFQITN